MAITHIASASGKGTATNQTNTNTSTAINSTGANLVVAYFNWNSGGANPTNVVDSYGNSYTGRTAVVNVQAKGQLYDCISPTVGSSHTVSYDIGGYTAGSLCVSAFAGVDTGVSYFDGEQGGTASFTTTIQPGSITPSADGGLVVTGVNDFTVDASSIDSSFTIAASTTGYDANCFMSAIAYLIQTSAGAVNPTWTHTGTANRSVAVIAAYLAGSGASSAIATIKGVAKASVATVKGLAIASVKTVGGLA